MLTERKATHNARLKLTRLARKGDDLLILYDRPDRGAAPPLLGVLADMQAWRRDTLETAKGLRHDYRDHFADIGEYEPETFRTLTVTIIGRIRDVLACMERSP